MEKVTKQELLNSIDKFSEVAKNSGKVSDKEGFEIFINSLKRSASEADESNPSISSFKGLIDCLTNVSKDGKGN